MVWLLALLLSQADDPTTVAAKLDAAIGGIPGIAGKPEPKPVGDDAFIRRLYKDLVEVAPTAAEAQAFAADPNPNKRAALIDQLLADDRFGGYWARRFTSTWFGDPSKLRFVDLQGLPEGFEQKVLKNFEGWLAGRLRKDVPWNQVVYDILDSRGTTEGDPAMAYKLSFYRGKEMPLDFAQGMARDFLGIRLYCTRCHDHPYDRWTIDDLYGMAAFIARQRVRIVDGTMVELKHSDSGELILPGARALVIEPKFLFGGKPGQFDDRMKLLGFYLSQRSTIQVPRVLVNRAWAWLFGAGIHHPLDDFGLMYKPISPALLDILTRDVADHQISLRRLVQVICLTKAYQMPTPEEMPEVATFRHLARARASTLGYSPLGDSPPVIPLAFDAPAAWERVRDRQGSKALFIVRGKQDASQRAEFALLQGNMSRWTVNSNLKQFVNPKVTKDLLEGKLKATWKEVAGPNTCIRGQDGPTEFVAIAVVVEAPAGPFTFRFEGPASVVEEWRAEVVALVKSAVPR